MTAKEIPEFDYSHMKPELQGMRLDEAIKLILNAMVKHYNEHIVKPLNDKR